MLDSVTTNTSRSRSYFAFEGFMFIHPQHLQLRNSLLWGLEPQGNETPCCTQPIVKMLENINLNTLLPITEYHFQEFLP